LFICWAARIFPEHRDADARAKENGHFRLTMREAKAYIRPIGAPSAYGAIARL
jgi:hypothetical protein